MREAQLGSFTTSALGLGCMGFSQGYGPTDDADSIAAIRTAVEHGVGLLDTAMSYGAGHNEQLVARALDALGPAAATVAVATKFGIVRSADGVRVRARPADVRGYCEASLRRLRRDVIDVYYLHRADPQVPIADTVGAMAELVSAGKVRHLGVCELTPEQLAAAASVHPIAALQTEWSLAWREPERQLIPTARRLGIGVVPYSPLGRGLLTGTIDAGNAATSDFRVHDPRFSGAALQANLHQVQTLRAVARRLDATPGQVALAWLLAQGRDVAPIPGSRSAARIAENAAAADLVLPPDALTELSATAWTGDRHSFAVPTTARTGA